MYQSHSTVNTVEKGGHEAPLTPRHCISCNAVIPAKRIKAIPTASKCVSCTEAAGDIKIRRYDETLPDGQIVSTHFKVPSVYIADQLARFRIQAASTMREVE